MASAFALLSLSLLQVDAGPPEQGPSAATMVKALSEENELLKDGHATKIFAAILEQDVQPARPGTRSAPAIELLKSADELVKTILRSWLERPRPLGSSPPTMQEWREFRSKVVGHVEAIVLEAVLTPEQARRWRKQADPALVPPMRGRYSIIPVDDSDGHDLRDFTRDRYYSIIYDKSIDMGPSEVFRVILGHDRLNVYAGLQTRDVEALRALEGLVRAVKKFWWLRGIEKPPMAVDHPEGISALPPTREMQEKLSDRGSLVLASIVAHAESVALDTIMSADSAEQVKVQCWRDRGVNALLDPELASRIQLTVIQREKIAARLVNRIGAYHDLRRTIVPTFPAGTPKEVVDQARRQRKLEMDMKIQELDSPTWDILYPSQRRQLTTLLQPDQAKKR